MLLQQYNSNRKHKNSDKNLLFLNTFFFPGATKYLGVAVDGELLDDGTWKEYSYTRRFNRMKWFNPWHKHIRGRYHGVVDDNQAYVPFVSIDIDRHNNEPMEQHKSQCIELFANLSKRLRWMWEFNPINGSFKFFGFKYKPIPIAEAKQIAQEIKDRLSFECEIFPLNSHAVWLPLKSEKTTLIDTGKLKREMKKRLVNEKMEVVEVYSLDAYANWIRFGGNVKLEAVLAELDKIEEKEEAAKEITTIVRVKEDKPTKAKRVKAKAGLSDGNPLTRQFPALQAFSRKLKRVPTVDEALDHLRETGNYSGDWEDDAQRNRRVPQMLNRIARTFDPEKVGGNSYNIPLGKWWAWARKYAKYFVHEEINDRGKVKWRISITIHELSTAMSIIEYCGKIDPNEDGTIPTNRVRTIWNQLYDAGKIKKQWKNGKWKLIRNTLERLSVISVNHIFYRGKAMVWQLSEIFGVVQKAVKKAVNTLSQSFNTVANNILHSLSSLHNSLCSEGKREKDEIDEIEVVELIRPPIRPLSQQLHEEMFELSIELQMEIANYKTISEEIYSKYHSNW